MAYSTVVHYFESNQVTKFSLDLNTGVITMTLKEGAQELPNAAEQSTAQSTGGLLSGLLSSSSAAPTGVKKNEDGTETVSYKLPYARMFVDHVSDYIAQYDAANPDAPMVYDYVPAKETIPWMEILFYLAMLGCTGFLLFSMMRGGAGGGGIMNVGKARVKDEHENKKTATFADVAGEDEEKEELKEVVEFLKSPDKFNTLGARFPHGVRPQCAEPGPYRMPGVRRGNGIFPGRQRPDEQDEQQQRQQRKQKGTGAASAWNGKGFHVGNLRSQYLSSSREAGASAALWPFRHPHGRCPCRNSGRNHIR